MPREQHDGPGVVPSEMASGLAGIPLGNDIIYRTQRELNPQNYQEHNLALQVAEIYNIRKTADRIEQLLAERDLPLPSVYTLHTAGFDFPFENPVVLGRLAPNGILDESERDHRNRFAQYGQDAPFELIPQPDILGHAGEVAVAQIDGKHTAMSFLGRDHPYEEAYDPIAPFENARKIRIIKELIRRQRERGENPIAITTYLSGVVEGHPLKPGDIGVIFDDNELGHGTHPGLGHRAILDKFLGSRFQPKAGRDSNMELAQAFYKQAQEFKAPPGRTDIEDGPVPVGSVAIMGTPSATEFEGFLDTGLGISAFEIARKIGLDELVKRFYPEQTSSSFIKDMLYPLIRQKIGERLIRITQDNRFKGRAREIYKYRKHAPSLVFGMSNTAELAQLREVINKPDPEPSMEDHIIREADFPFLALTLITDSVGKGSFNIDHNQVVGNALATSPRNTLLLKQFIEAVTRGQIKVPQPTHPSYAKFSLKETLFEEAEKLAEEKAEESLKDNPSPQDLAGLIAYYQRLRQTELDTIKYIGVWGYPEAERNRKVYVDEYDVLLASLHGDGRKALQYFENMRNVHLRAAEGRTNTGQFRNALPEGKKEKRPEQFFEDRKKWHLERAKFYDNLADIVRTEKNLRQEEVS